MHKNKSKFIPNIILFLAVFGILSVIAFFIFNFVMTKLDPCYKEKVSNLDSTGFKIVDGHVCVRHGSFPRLKTFGKEINSEKVKEEGVYLLDDKNIYLNDGYSYKKLENIDLETFDIFADGNYAKDKNGVYFQGNILDNVNKDSFVNLDSFYSKDDKNVFVKIDCCSVKKMENVDFDSFMIFDDGFAKDKNNCYKNGGVVEMSECDKLKEKVPNYDLHGNVLSGSEVDSSLETNIDSDSSDENYEGNLNEDE